MLVPVHQSGCGKHSLVADDHPPAYDGHHTSSLAAAPQVAIDYSYTLNPRMSYRIADTGVDKPVSMAQGHPNLVMGSDRHTITFRERTTLIDKHLGELDRLTSSAPKEGYPRHSVESFKTAQLVKTISVLSDVKIPTHASKQYMEKIQGLIAIHERMVQMEKTLEATEERRSSGEPIGEPSVQ